MALNLLNAQQQRQAAAEQAALNYLPQFDQEFAYYQGVLASGGDPRVFFGQNLLPSPGINLFLNPFFVGPSLPVFYSSFSTPAFVPAFLNGLNSLASPIIPLAPLSFVPVKPPGSCTVGNFFLPTTISFYNLSSKPLLLSLIDTRCQEIPQILLPPQRSFVSLTFVGQTWSFRNGLTGELVLGDNYVTVRDTTPLIEITTDVLSASQIRVESSARSSLSATPDLPAISSSGAVLADRLAAMRERQNDQVYSDPALQTLQAEASAYFLGQIYADPLALYLQQERDALNNQVRVFSPDYAEAKTLAAEIAGWSDAPSDSTLLRARYAKRTRLELLTSHIDDDFATYLIEHPDTAAQLDDLAQRLQERTDTLRHTPEALLWQADWQQRWDQAYYTSNRGIAETQELLDIQSHNPDFATYQNLNNEVGKILPSLSDTPPMQRIADLQRRVDTDTGVRLRLRALEDQFHAASTAAYDSSGAAPIMEQFYERINALGQADAAYRNLKASGDMAVSRLDVFRADVHAAVATCYVRNGESCDPTTDHDVQNLLLSGRAAPLVSAVTAFHQKHDAFWHSFYSGADYLDLENQAKADLKAPIGAAQSSLDAAHSAYDKGKAGIPELNALQTAQKRIYTDLCSSSSLNALPVSDPTVALCPRLNRMAQLSHSLKSASTSLQATNAIYLPLVKR